MRTQNNFSAWHGRFLVISSTWKTVHSVCLDHACEAVSLRCELLPWFLELAAKLRILRIATNQDYSNLNLHLSTAVHKRAECAEYMWRCALHVTALLATMCVTCDWVRYIWLCVCYLWRCWTCMHVGRINVRSAFWWVTSMLVWLCRSMFKLIWLPECSLFVNLLLCSASFCNGFSLDYWTALPLSYNLCTWRTALESKVLQGGLGLRLNYICGSCSRSQNIRIRIVTKHVRRWLLCT